jgi:transcriptional regulator with XRE-family HTH domain
MAAIPKTPQIVLKEIAAKFRVRRLALNLTQEELAARSDVSLPSLRRFERSGRIALESLLRLASVLRCLRDFDAVAAQSAHVVTAGRTLDQILAAEPKHRRRASGGRGSGK